MADSFEVALYTEGDDHDYPHLTGYFAAFCGKLTPPISTEELELVMHITCFAHQGGTVTTFAGITELAKRIITSSRSIESRRRMVRARLASLKDKGYVIVTPRHKEGTNQNYHSLIDLRPLFAATRKLALEDGWFGIKVAEGVIVQSGGGDSTVRGGGDWAIIRK